MSRHRSPAGRRAHPGPVPGRAARPVAPLPSGGPHPPAVWMPRLGPTAGPPLPRAPHPPPGVGPGPRAVGRIPPPPPGPLRPAPPRPPRHTAPALRNGLTGAAATGAALAVVIPALGALPTAPDDRALTIAAAGVAAPVLAPAAGVTVDTASDTASDTVFDTASGTASDGPERMLLASLTPVRTVEADLPPAADAAGLIKSVGLVEAARAAEEARLAREARADCDADLDGLGRVKPWVRDAARFLSCLYDEPTLIGVADRARVSDHPRGLAVDLMVRGERGDRIAECALANQRVLGITYVIWEQRVNYGDGWERMSDRGGDTENHFDHVHISFERGGGSGDPLAERCG